jgi:hypothetical protein
MTESSNMREFASATGALSNAMSSGADESVVQTLEDRATGAFRRLVSELGGGPQVY